MYALSRLCVSKMDTMKSFTILTIIIDILTDKYETSSGPQCKGHFKHRIRKIKMFFFLLHVHPESSLHIKDIHNEKFLSFEDNYRCNLTKKYETGLRLEWQGSFLAPDL